MSSTFQVLSPPKRSSYVSYKTTTTSGATLVKTGPGVLQSITVNTATTGSISVYDGTDSTGTAIAVITLAAGNPVTLNYGIAFQVGLALVVVGAAVNATTVFL